LAGRLGKHGTLEKIREPVPTKPSLPLQEKRSLLGIPKEAWGRGTKGLLREGSCMEKKRKSEPASDKKNKGKREDA